MLSFSLFASTLLLLAQKNSHAAAADVSASSSLRGNRNLAVTGKITSLILVNSISDTRIVELRNGTVITVNSIAGMTSPSFNINATYSGTDIKSARFGYNTTSNFNTINTPILSFCGNLDRDFYRCSRLGIGTHTVTVTPYTAKNAGGEAGRPYRVTFTIVQGAPPTKAPTKSPTKAPTKPPVKPPVKPPTNAPVVTQTTTPVLPPSVTGCHSLEGCYLRNLDTGSELALTGVDTYVVENLANGYSIRCAVNGTGHSDLIKFAYNGKEHDEYGEPRWLDGDSGAGTYIVPVPYLSTCGTKVIKIQGHTWTNMCFEKYYTLTAQCPTSPPVVAPVAAPVAAPVVAAPTVPTATPFNGITTLELIYTGVVPNVAVMNLNLGTTNVVNLGALRLPSTATFNINAVRNDDTVNSVQFTNNGQKESSLPWAYCGNVGPVYNNCGDLVSGRTVNVTIVPYPLSGQAGTPYPMIWSTIKIIDGTVAPTITRRPTSAPVTRKPTMAPAIPPPTAPVTPPPPKPQNCSIPKFVGSWQSRTAHFPVAEAQGAMIGTDMVIVGGFLAGFNNVSTQTNVLDTTNASATWQRMDDYPFPIGLTHGAFVVVGTKFYICGGYAGGGIGMHTDVCMVYDHSQPKGVGRQWSLFTPLPDGGRAGGGMVYDSTLNALIFAAGATRPVPQKRSALDHNNTWIYSLSNPTAGWQPRAPMPFHANHMSFVTGYDAMGIERHYFTGGQKQEDEPEGNVADHYEYDAIKNVWIKRKFMTIPRSHAASSTRPFGCGFIMVAGCTNGGLKIADVAYYDIPSDTWTSLGNFTNNINTPVCDISNGVLYCDTGYDSGKISKKIAISR